MATTPRETSSRAFDRGREAGEIAGQISARLEGHDRHFEAINGSIAKVAAELHVITLTMQRLADQAAARDATTVATSQARRDAGEAQRYTAADNWSRWQKVFAVLAAIGVVVGAVAALWVFGTPRPIP